MRFRFFPLSGAVVLVLLIVMIFVGYSFSPQFSSALRQRVFFLQRPIVMNQEFAFYDPFGKPYPLTVDRGFGTKLMVSGWVQEESLYKDRSITVAVPTTTNSVGYWVKAYLPDDATQIGLLKLEKGKFGTTQNWEIVRLEGDLDLTEPGRQIVLHFNTTEEETKRIINDFQNTKGQKQIELRSLIQLAVGVYE